MSRSLIIALTLSLVLHGSVLSMNAPRFSPAPRVPAIQASLRSALPPEPEILPETPSVAEALLKNTIEDNPPAEPASAPPRSSREKRETPIPSSSTPHPTHPMPMETVRQQLAEYVFYPEEARRLGLEGTVTLFVELSGDGRVEDVRIAASSGFPILDNAAVKGFYAVGRLPGKSDYWDYTFRLE